MGTSWKNKLVGAVAAGAIVAGLFPVSAFGVPDSSITVSGLEEGDTAVYYQIVQQDQSADITGQTYTQATEFNASAEYYTKSGSTYNKVTDVTADNFGDGTYYTKDSMGTKSWKLTDAVDSDHDGKIDGSNYTVSDLISKTTNNVTDHVVITADIANAISSALTKNGASSTSMGTATKGEGETSAKVTKTIAAADPDTGVSPDAGIYMVVATPGTNNKNIVYKPVFVSSDYDADDATDTYGLATDESQYKKDANEKSIFKKSKVTIDKESGTAADETTGTIEDRQNDVAVGDVVDFTITVPLVTYTKNYTKAQFKISDVLSTGLELQAKEASKYDDIKVEVKIGNGSNLATKPTNDDAGDYKITGLTTTGFTVEFQGDADRKTDADKDGTATNDQDGFLYNAANSGATVTITYKAKVTSTAGLQVNQMNNTAKLEFSNNPSNEDALGELKDRTRHYTFDIDGNIMGGGVPNLGPEGKKTSEIRKVGIDAEGNVIQEETTSEEIIDDGKPAEAKYDWLKGAEFKLVKTKSHTNTADGTGVFTTLDEPEQIYFNADGLRVPAGADGAGNAKSGDNGYIPMKGLDAGEYELTEVKAPLGYAFNPNAKYVITITPTYVAEPEGTTDDGVDGSGDLILKQYEVKIVADKLDNNQEIIPGEKVTTTTIYKAGEDANHNPISFLNETDDENDGTVNSNPEMTFDQSSNGGTALIVNKKLGLLPATGGSGIYFYLAVGGAIAGVSLYLMKKDERAEAAE